MTIVAGRLIIAALVLVPVAAFAGTLIPPRESWLAVVLIAILNNVIPFGLITTAQEHIDSSLAATLVGTMPLFVLLITFGIGTERPSLTKVLGLLIGFIGAVVVIGPDLGDLTNASTQGELAVTAAALCYGISTVIARQWAKGPALALSAAQFVVAALIATPIALAVDGAGIGSISSQAAASWIVLGVFCSGGAYIIFYHLVQRVAATQVSLVSYLIPIVATVLGWAVLDERIGINLVVGLVLIIAGVMAVNGAFSAALARVRPDAGVG